MVDAAAGPTWPRAQDIDTVRLTLEALRIDHADEVAAALDDRHLHQFIGGSPSSPRELHDRFTRMVVGHSPDGGEGWLNWIIRDRTTKSAVGTVQATLTERRDATIAELAWVVAGASQGKGIATEASSGVLAWLRGHAVVSFIAHVHPDHEASQAVARHLGLSPTGNVVDGEQEWSR